MRLLVLLLAVAAYSQQLPSSSKLERLLVSRFGAKPADLALVRSGEAFVTAIDGSVDREVAVAGVIRIDAPAARTVDLIRQIERLESGGGFLATRRLSQPPKIEDFAGFQVHKDDITALRKCRPGKCGVKLGKGAFDSVARIDWKAPDVVAKVNQLAHRMALEYIQAYQHGGNSELAVYVDSDRPQFIAQEFEDMLKRFDMLPDPDPELKRFLLEYPSAPRAKGAEDFFYWSEAAFGLKPVFRLNHVAIHPLGALTKYIVATKQLYANHYFQTALELRALIDDETRPGKAHYLLVLNMARSDGLSGAFGGIIKSKARSGSKEGLRQALRITKQKVEE
jgi:hypothetical protein